MRSKSYIYEITYSPRLWRFNAGEAYTSSMRRDIQFKLYDHQVTCPHCDVKLVFTSPQETLIKTWKSCPNCDNEFLIENGQTKKDLSLTKRPPATVTEIKKNPNS